MTDLSRPVSTLRAAMPAGDVGAAAPRVASEMAAASCAMAATSVLFNPLDVVPAPGSTWKFLSFRSAISE